MKTYYRTYAEVSLRAIGQNINEVRKKIAPDVRLLAVVKADAYGHGAVRVSTYLQDRVDFFAVATPEEAAELRENGIFKPVLILGYASPCQYQKMIEEDVRLSIYRLKDAEELNRVAEASGKKAKVHIAVDTGMTRIGFHDTEADADAVVGIAAMPNVEIEGMFTHFSCADQQDKTYCMGQIQKYEHMRKMLEKRGLQIPICHVCNSAGVMEFDQYRYGMVRSGIITYGLYPSDEVLKTMPLLPALQWRAHVIHVQDVEPGVGVSYGATYVTTKAVTRIATVSVGYADGYPRALSSKGRVLLHGQYAPILGRVCMDQMMVDVSGIPNVQVEDVVTLVGRDGENVIPIEEIADPAGRFNYEMLCNISPRVQRLYDVDEEKND